MSKKLQFVSLPNLYHLTSGLTFNISACSEVLDSTLTALNVKTKIPQKIVEWNRTHPDKRPPLLFPEFDGLTIFVEQSYTHKSGNLDTATVVKSENNHGRAPAVFFPMRSPTLDIPMRLEVPLRALMKGGQHLKGTYAVYLHCLLTNTGAEFVYYGITKRAVNVRFSEHTKAAFQDHSTRLFPSKLDKLTQARVDFVYKKQPKSEMLDRLITIVCAIGLNEDAPMDTEEYLVDKYSLASKHASGLNMIPGGYEGVRVLHRLSLLKKREVSDTEDREEIFSSFLRAHPQFGIPKPGVAEKWMDASYAEAVICGRENRLSGDQVREIRYLRALGAPIEQIVVKVGAANGAQVHRVLAGRTYSRIN